MHRYGLIDNETELLVFALHNNCDADINECLSNPCDQICDNTMGSFECRCASGYSLEGSVCRGI